MAVRIFEAIFFTYLIIKQVVNSYTTFYLIAIVYYLTISYFGMKTKSKFDSSKINVETWPEAI